MEVDSGLIGLAKATHKEYTVPTFIPNKFKAGLSLDNPPENFKGSMVIKAGLKSYKKKTPVRFFRISNKSWGIIVGDF